MYIFDLNYPGTWLQFEDEEIKREIESMFMSLEGIITEAAISLSMFEACRNKRSNVHSEFEKDAELRHEVDEKIREEAGEHYYQDYEKYRIIAEKRLRLKKSQLGILPRSYIHKIPFIHAHTFVYAVDSFGKFLEELCIYDGMPKEVQHYCDEFNRLLPTVRKIRNSALHIEDRSRGYGTYQDKKKGKKMNIKDFLGLSVLENNQLCYTIADGSYQRIEISKPVLEVLVQITNYLLACFKWEGSPRVVPHY